MSDTSSGFAYVSLHDIFANMDMVDETKTRLADQAKRILIVDDDALSLELLKQLLEPEGYLINTATDGIDALHEISKAKYDLILSDISMPNFSGYQLLAFMQQKNIDIPVVFISGHVTTEDEIKGLKMGAVEYLKKPVQPDLLLLRLQKLLQH
jgi:DNA-binding response OmpR family regulator